MNATLRDSIRAGLAVPLLLVAALAGVLGFVAARTVSGDMSVPRVSVITTRGEVAPAPAPEPLETPSEETSGSGGRRRSCPTGCDCEFPPGGLIVRCTGGRASVRTEPEAQAQQPSGELPRERFDLPAMD